MRNKYFKSIVLLIYDVIAVTSAIVVANYLVNYNFLWGKNDKIILLFSAVLLQPLIFLRFGLYRAVLRHASIDFLITVVKAVSVSMLALVFGVYIAQIHFTPQVLFTTWILNIFLVGGGRFMIRYYFELRRRFLKGRRVLIYGAGDMGILAARQLKLNKELLYTPVGFIDDNLSKRGSVVDGTKVLGSLAEMQQMIEIYHVEEVIIAIAGIEGEKIREVVRRCKESNMLCRTLPSFSKMLEIHADMRNIELADLLRRSVRGMDISAIEKYLFDKRVLITGAAGSIGSELFSQCLQFKPSRLVALDNSEYGLYTLSEKSGNKKIDYILADVTNSEVMENVFAKCLPEIVFHAAAYKHVPMLEENPNAAIWNNIGGTRNVAELSDKYGVESFVLISTDKAVKPTSIMGATKKVCELIVQNFNSVSTTEFVVVRFGNVLGSSGSVIPKFLEQIKNGGPVTVTHPDMTRFFMLRDEAVQLVLQASAIGKGGEIFILNMGKPVKIVELAEDLIFLMGRRLGKDIKVVFTGPRNGEKIHEELINDETEKRTRFEDIMVGRTTVLDWSWLKEKVDILLSREFNNSFDKAVQVLYDLVPEGDFAQAMMNDGFSHEYSNFGNKIINKEISDEGKVVLYS